MSNDPLKPRPDCQRFFWGFLAARHCGAFGAMPGNYNDSPEMRRQGIGQQCVRHTVIVAQERGVEWVHVDFEPHVQHFYQQCGFRWTAAGLLHVAVAHRA
jgi:GNAT superfamily N-acetyltransferase